MPTPQPIQGDALNSRRIQINQNGSWCTMLRFSDKKGREYVGEVLAVAQELANLVEGATMRLLDDTGAVMMYWSAAEGWH